MASVIFVAALAVTARLSASYILTDLLGNEVEDPNLNKWPDVCAGKYYCWVKNGAYEKRQKIFDELLSNQILESRMGDEIGDRDGIKVKDIGNCQPTIKPLKTIYMIKDKDGTVWYVPQSANFTFSFQIEECKKLQGLEEYRITKYDNTIMQPEELHIKNVQCVEQKLHYEFPVLKQINNEYGIILRSPYKGLPLSCSTKIVKTSGNLHGNV